MLVFTDTFVKVGIKNMVFHDAVMDLKKKKHLIVPLSVKSINN